MARPTKVTPKVQDQVVACIASGMSLAATSDRVGVNRTNLSDAIQRDPAFAARVVEAKRQAEAKQREARANQGTAARNATPSRAERAAAQRARAREDAEARFTDPDEPLTTMHPDAAQAVMAHRTPTPNGSQNLTDTQRAAAQDLFLTRYGDDGNITKACQKAGISRSTFHRWMEHDVAFEVRYHEAQERTKDTVRSAIFRRAVLGVRRPLHQNGRVVMQRGEGGQDVPVMVTEYSDTLAMFHAKMLMPEYREKTQQQVEISGPGGMPLHGSPPPDAHTFTLSLRGMSDDDLAALHAIMARAAEREREMAAPPAVGAWPA